MTTTQNSQRRQLTKEEKEILCCLADPVAICPQIEKINNVNLNILFGAINHHGIEPVSLRKLKMLQIDVQDELANLISEVGARQFVANAMAMTLENCARNILTRLTESGLPGVIIKGPVFAADLYPQLSDRPYTDIDILTPVSDLKRIGELMRNMGYNQAKRNFWDGSERNMEQKWIAEDTASVLIELHTNLVHYPNLRSRISFGYQQYELASQGGKFPAAANFLVAVIHAAAGHKFHKLQLLVDVLQAFRKMEQKDINSLETTLRIIPAQLEVMVCLDLIQSLFEGVQTAETLGQLGLKSKFKTVRKLVNADLVLDTYFDRRHKSRLCRHAFRFLQKKVAR